MGRTVFTSSNFICNRNFSSGGHNGMTLNESTHSVNSLRSSGDGHIPKPSKKKSSAQKKANTGGKGVPGCLTRRKP